VARRQRPAALGQPRHHLPQLRAEQPRLALDQVRVDGPDVLQVRSLARCLAASRQRSSTDDRSPGAAMIGVSSWLVACRKMPGIWVARTTPADTNAA
jgi:hypothetical protein